MQLQQLQHVNVSNDHYINLALVAGALILASCKWAMIMSAKYAVATAAPLAVVATTAAVVVAPVAADAVIVAPGVIETVAEAPSLTATFSSIMKSFGSCLGYLSSLLETLIQRFPWATLPHHFYLKICNGENTLVQNILDLFYMGIITRIEYDTIMNFLSNSIPEVTGYLYRNLVHDVIIMQLQPILVTINNQLHLGIIDLTNTGYLQALYQGTLHTVYYSASQLSTMVSNQVAWVGGIVINTLPMTMFTTLNAFVEYQITRHGLFNYRYAFMFPIGANLDLLSRIQFLDIYNNLISFRNDVPDSTIDGLCMVVPSAYDLLVNSATTFSGIYW